MPKAKTRRREKQQPIEVPDDQDVRPRWFGVVTWLAVGVVAAGVGLWLAKQQAERGAKQVAPPPVGLPHTPDYHALLVSSTNARVLVLGTHAGLYESSDGGRTWRKGPLARKDAMNLVRTRIGRIWAAGHYVLFASDDGGRTWENVRPSGLPNLDLHGFAADPRDGDTLYAAVAHKGLYRSEDGGSTFALVTKEVGGNARGLAVTPAGRIFAADPRRGLLASDDRGRSWTTVLQRGVIGVAVNPMHPRSVLAVGLEIFRSRDGGRRWRSVLRLKHPAEPVAWAPSRPHVAYFVAYDRRLYRTGDGGRTWQPVR